MAIKVLIVDDEKKVRDSLSEILRMYYPGMAEIECCADVSSAVKAIKSGPPDVVLLDIEIGNESGFDIFKESSIPAFKVIFITAYRQYALDAFRFSALDYLLKPVDPDLLVQAVNKAQDLIDKEKLALKLDSFLHNLSVSDGASKKIVLKTASTIHIVKLKDIIYCEADHSYTSFYLSDKSHIVVSYPIGKYEEMLGDYGFFRLHQSYLLNVDYLKQYEKGDGGHVILSDNTRLPVATRKKDQLLHLMSRL